MSALGILFILAGGVSVGYGFYLNSNIEVQLSSIFSSGQTNPGTVWIVAGGIGVLLGILMTILGAAGRKKTVVTQHVIYTPPGYVPGQVPPPYPPGYVPGQVPPPYPPGYAPGQAPYGVPQATQAPPPRRPK